MKKFLQDRKRLLLLVSPAIIGAVFLFLCFSNYGQSVNYQESIYAFRTRSDFSSILSSAFSEAEPPLYSIALKTWSHYIGHSVIIMRAMSAIFGAIAIVFAFLWLKYKYGSTVAIVSSFMMAISPIFVHSGQSIAPYTMLLAVVFAATFFLQLAIDNGKKIWWILYALLLIVGMGISYFSLFAWIAHFVYLITIYHKDIIHQKFIYIFLLPIALYLPWIFSPAYGVGSELAISNIMDTISIALLYERADHVTNWLLIPFIVDILIIVLLAIHCHRNTRLLTSLTAVPVIAILIFSLPPFKVIFNSNHIIYSMVALNALAGATLTMYAREKYAKKRKKTKKILVRHPEIAIMFSIVVLIAVPIIGITSVYAKGNYDFATGKKVTAAELFENIVALDARENLSIITTTKDVYYELSVYESYQHDVHYLNDLDLDKFLEKRDAIWLVGIAPENGTFDFSRDNWRMTTFANMQFDDDGEAYQILKIEKE